MAMNRRATLVTLGAGSLGALVATPSRAAAAPAMTSHVVNVKDFGAVGNALTDDTIAIQRAIASLPSNGGVVYFPAGVYQNNQSLGIGMGVRLQGDGYAASTIFSDAPDLWCILDVTGRYASVIDLKLQGPDRRATIGAAVKGEGFHAYGCFFEKLGIGVLLENGSQHAIDDCYFNNVGDYGIYIAGGGAAVGDSYVRNCVISKGIADAAPPEDWTGIAIALASGANAIHLHNIGIAGFETGIWVGLAGVTGNTPENIWLSDVNVDSVRHRAVDLVQGRRIAATMCGFRSNSDIGVVVQAAWDGANFANCHFVGSRLQGLYTCDGARHVQVTGGVVTANLGGGVLAEAGSDIQITGTDFGSGFYGHGEQQPYGVKLDPAGSGPHIAMVTGCRFWNTAGTGLDTNGVRASGLESGSKVLVRNNLGAPDYSVG
jgi:hypothetical protein